jgi:hypothetical protein
VQHLDSGNLSITLAPRAPDLSKAALTDQAIEVVTRDLHGV